MAYINQTQDSRRRATAVAGVVAVHTVLALALLSMGVVGTTEISPPWDPFVITPDPIPTPTPPPVPKVSSPTQPDRAISPPLPIFEWHDLPELPVDDGIIRDFRPEVGDTPFVMPTPQPAPSYTPKGAVPANRPAGWITTDDYPARPLRDEVEGVAGYRVIVGSNGLVSSCEITGSTGNPTLDVTTCRLISRRARFEAATDETGASVVGSYTGKVRWEIPD